MTGKNEQVKMNKIQPPTKINHISFCGEEKKMFQSLIHLIPRALMTNKLDRNMSTGLATKKSNSRREQLAGDTRN